MKTTTRKEQFIELFPKEPAFRLKQIQKGLFNPNIQSWEGFTSLSKEMREKMMENINFMSVSQHKIVSSKTDQTIKAALKLTDGNLIETVLMPNSRNQYTICLSSQIGCAMGCRFCATGKMGLNRNLSVDEIVDQYRFWFYYINQQRLEKIITNIVVMGMGEPFANYENIKEAVNYFIDYAGIGLTHITISTVGIFPILNSVLADKDWPNVRVAISLHAADNETRKKIIPSTTDKYFSNLTQWSKDYLEKYGNRRHFLSFEYIMIKDLNDKISDAEKLVKLIKNIGQVKVNLIPCNDVLASGLDKSQSEQIKKFAEYLLKNNIRVTVRRSMGQDIEAACGQLVTKEKTSGKT